MTANELRRVMQTLLAEEREGILRFDAALMTRANETKALVLRRLHQAPAAERAPLRAVLEELQPDLRCNQILLAHAHAYLEDMREMELEREATESIVVPLLRRKAG